LVIPKAWLNCIFISVIDSEPKRSSIVSSQLLNPSAPLTSSQGNLNRLTSKLPKKFRLRTVLVVPFIIPIFVSTGLVGWLSFRNGQRAIDDLATQLNSEISNRIQQHVLGYLNKSNQVLQITNAGIQSDNLKLNNFAALQRYFWRIVQNRDTETETYLSFGNEQGEFVGVEHLENGRFQLKIRTQEIAPKREVYFLDDQGNRAMLANRAEYDPRQRPWYQAAKQAGKPTWSPIYPFFSRKNTSLGISSVMPIFESTDKLLGVLCINVTLTRITEFIENLRISPHGQSFVLERSGDLVVSSKIQQPFLVKGEGDNREIERIKAISSNNSTVRATAQHLIQRFGNLSAINSSQNLKFKMEGAWQYVQVLPCQDERGIDWLIVVVVPESDFMGQINANTRTTILLCLVTLVVATTIGILTARWISKQILKLNKASQEIARGDLDQNIEVNGIIEIENLSGSFNSMAHQLQESFDSLEAKNADLEQAKEALAQAKEQLEAVLNAVPGSISWVDSNGLYLGVNRHLAESLNLTPDTIVGKEIGFFKNSSQYAEFMRQFLASAESSSSQEILVNVHGSVRYYLMAVQKYQQGTATVSVGIDVTKRRQAQEALRIAEENYRSIFENALEGIFQSTSDGHYISINPAMARLHGYDSPDDMMVSVTEIGRQLYVDPSCRSEFKRLMQEKGEVKSFEYQVYRKDSSIIWVEENTRAVRDTSGKVLYYEGIIQDISKRKQEEDALKRQLQELRIEIDQQKRKQDVAEITQSDYFQELQAAVESLRFDEDW
jgi:PAS domain S-box-containing protein